MAKCIFCGGRAELLCDSRLGWERMRGEMAKDAPNLLALSSDCIPSRYRVVHTCDAPLCRACAVSDGTMHFRLRHGPSFSESVDYCPGHSFGTLRKEITGLEAEAMRAAWRRSARTKR